MTAVHLAMEAGEAGADYVAFGAFFPTQTKEPKTSADIELLRWWSETMMVPVRRHRRHHGRTTRPRWSKPAPISWPWRAGVWEHADGPARGGAGSSTRCSHHERAPARLPLLRHPAGLQRSTGCWTGFMPISPPRLWFQTHWVLVLRRHSGRAAGGAGLSFGFFRRGMSLVGNLPGASDHRGHHLPDAGRGLFLLEMVLLATAV